MEVNEQLNTKETKNVIYSVRYITIVDISIKYSSVGVLHLNN